METNTDILYPATPAAENDWINEDSGYHTSFTPSSMECSDFKENLKNSANVQPQETRIIRYRNRFACTPLATCHEDQIHSPTARRGLKRSYPDDRDTSTATPTSVIAGGIQKLKVNDLNNSSTSQHDDHSFTSDMVSLDVFLQTSSLPTTPKKRKNEESPTSNYNYCSSPLQRLLCCPPRRSARKLNLLNSQVFQESSIVPITKPKVHSKVARKIFRPDQKVDMLRMLSADIPAIIVLFSYLSNEDIYNCSAVSKTWRGICETVAEAKTKKEEYSEFITNTKENHENRNKIKMNDVTRQSNDLQKASAPFLKDIHNVLSSRQMKDSPLKSPPTTPKSRNFRRFTKSASLDDRMQLSCVRCSHPAKVTLELTGEESVECTSLACSYKFCRLCACELHPGKSCIKYDLEGPSPSKRRKSSSIVGTQKSKKSLRRLMC